MMVIKQLRLMDAFVLNNSLIVLNFILVSGVSLQRQSHTMAKVKSDDTTIVDNDGK